jgi:predicted transcriptional regulator
MNQAIKFYRAGLREIGGAALLELAGNCGTAGLTTPDATEAMRMPAATVHLHFQRLVEAGLVHRPTRDTGQGRRNRYVIAPAGLALLQRLEPVVLPARQIPLLLPK